MGGPSLWNSNIVSTLQEPVSNNSSINSPDGQNGGNVSSGSGVIVQNNAGLTAVAAITTPIASSKKTSKSPNSSTGGNGGGGSTSSTNASSASSKSRSNKSKSKLSRVRYFLHPGEPPVGQIVSDSLTDGQLPDNNNTLSLKQPQVILPTFLYRPERTKKSKSSYISSA